MGNTCCQSSKAKHENHDHFSDEMLEETDFERKICLQEIDKITESISTSLNKSKNPYLESVYLFLDFIRQRLSLKIPFIQLVQMRTLRLAIQRFREALHEIRPQNSNEIMPEQKEKTVLQLEGILKTQLGGNFSMGFYDSDEKFIGFDQIFEKMKKIQAEIKEKENKIPMLLWKLTTNISANFWINSFQGSTAKWKEFSEAFKKFSSKSLDINLEPHDFITIRTEIDINNDLIVEVENWDYFYNEIWSNSCKRSNLLYKASELKEILLSPSNNLLELKFFRNGVLPPESREVFFPNNSFFYIKDDKIKYSSEFNLQPKDKDLYNSVILAGKHPKAEISFDKSIKEVSVRQFQIHAKKVMTQQNESLTLLQKNSTQNEPFGLDSGSLGLKSKVETWFYLNNMAKRNLVTFLVDEKGFALTKGMMVNINGNSFKINEINPSPMLYADEDLYYVDTRPKGPNKVSYKNPQDYFIDLEFFKNGPKDIKKYFYTVPKKEDFFQITIGSTKRKSKRSDIYIEDEHENYVAREHCVIVYNPKKSCWIIKDETYNKSILPFYKTYVFTCGYEEYEQIHKIEKEADYVARGQRLMDGMKITFVNNVFEVKLI